MTFSKVKDWIFARLNEKSTYAGAGMVVAGLASIATGFGHEAWSQALTGIGSALTLFGGGLMAATTTPNTDHG